MSTRITLASQARVIEALRLEVTQLQADLVIARQPKAAPSVRPAAPTQHWTRRPVFFVAFDKDYGFRARAAAAKKLNRVVALSPISTPRGTCYALY